jgi:hypothetical protein
VNLRGFGPQSSPVTSAEARDLLASRLGAERISAEPEAADELAALCALLPLALSIAAARAVADHHLPIAAVASGLRLAHSRLDALSADDAASSVPTVFSWSYQNLGAAAARMFRLLGIHPGPDISVPAAASLAGLPTEQARDALSELARTHLLSQPTQGRFTCHDLLRTYAAEQARAIDDDAVCDAALLRLLDHYLHTAHAGARLLHQGREPLTLEGPYAGVTPENLDDHEEALAWFEAEHDVLLAAAELAAATGFGTHAWQLPWTMVTYLYRRGHWDQWASSQRTALAVARRTGDRVGQARSHVELGYITTCVPSASSTWSLGFVCSLATISRASTIAGEPSPCTGKSVIATARRTPGRPSDIPTASWARIESRLTATSGHSPSDANSATGTTRPTSSATPAMLTTPSEI